MAAAETIEILQASTAEGDLERQGRLQQYTDKKENQIFLTYKEIQNGAVAKSYMTNDLLIYGEIFKHFLKY
jgi:hypothetical protein